MNDHSDHVDAGNAGKGPREQLNSYIRRLEGRLRAGVLLRGAAIVAAAALVTTIVLVLILNAFAFSRLSVGSGRAVLIALLVVAAAFFLAIPLSRLNRRSAVGRVESRFPHLEQRLVTFAERENAQDPHLEDPFLDLLAGDTLEAVRDAEPARVVPNRRLLVLAGGGLASLGVLLWVTLAAPGFLGYGASLLWSGHHPGAAPYYDIHVTPGDVAVRRNADQLITALPVGVQTDRVRLYARFHGATQWQQVQMQPRPGASGFQFLFAGLTEGLEYYVEAGPVHSRHYSIRIVDMPSVKSIRVQYRYPGWAGLRDVTEEHGGDLHALEGSSANLEVVTDRPLQRGVLVVNQGGQAQDTQIPLSAGAGNVYTGTIHIEKDGLYHVAAIDHGQPVRLSGDYFIEANPPQPPQVAIIRPGRDYRASPIEEVTVAVKAQDDYGLKDVDLHYSVNGGPGKTIDLLKQKGLKQADGSTVLSLENFKMVPGDVVSIYATAKDARADAHTDIYFVQADPFEREFSQSQEAGGGGGGGGGGQGNQPGDISQREKEIIAATWKQQEDKAESKAQVASNAQFLSGVQSKLADQAQSLSERMQSREMEQQNEEFASFVKDMNAAVAAMGPATDKLKGRKWSAAMPSEHKALQSLLRAESTFRQIEVAFGNRGGGGGGGGAGRDLASLFDLELDTQKNQYETTQTADSSAPRSQQIDDTLRKLEELARRQQQLAEQQRNQQAQSFQQRWQQEMLKRNAEELQRELEKLAQNQQSGQQGNQQGSQQSGQQSGQQGSQQGSQQPGRPGGRQSGGQSGASGGAQASAGESSGGQSQSGSSAAARRALDQLRQATEAMNSAGSSEQRAAAARRAADRLREATAALGGAQRQQASGRLDGMTRQAGQLSSEEQSQAERMRKFFAGQQGAGGAFGGNRSNSYQQLQQLANDRQHLSDGLTQLRQQMQQAERELAPTQQSAASKLRDALGQMEENDLMTRTQRSADWLRRGIDPNSNSSEASLNSGLQQLSQQLQQAQQALGTGNGQQQSPDGALEQLRRLRQQLEASNAAGRNGQNGRSRQGGRNGQQGQAGAGGQNGRSGQNGQPGGQSGAQPGEGNQAGQGVAGGQFGQLARGGQPGQAGFNGQPSQDGQPDGANGRAGDVRNGSRYNQGGNVNGGMDTGNNSNLPQPVAPDNSAIPADSESAIEQEMGELSQLRQAVANDPEALRQVQELIRQMQGLDPRRFPGNPEVFEQLHTQVLSEVDTLELRLTAAQQSGQIRSSAGDKVPAGYQDAVAEYFRQLSKRQ